MKPRFLHIAARAAIHTALASLGSGAAMAATVYWEGGITAETQVWSTAGNWSDTAAGDGEAGTTPASQDDAIFNATSITGARTVALGSADRTIRSLAFNSVDTVQFSSGGTAARRITIGSGGIVMDPGSGQVIFGNGNSNGVPVILGASQTWTNNSAHSIWTRNTVTGAAETAVTLNIDGTGNTNIAYSLNNGASSGTVGVVKSGAGMLTFSGGDASNSYTGPTTLTAGSISLAKTGDATAIPAGGLTVTDGTVTWNGDNQVSDAADITMSGGSGSLNGRSDTVHNLTIDGGTFLTGTGMLFADTITLGNSATPAKTSFTLNSSGTVITQALVMTGPARGTGASAGGNLLLGGTGNTAFVVGAGGLSMSGQNIQLNRSGDIAETGAHLVLQGNFTATGINKIGNGSGSTMTKASLNLAGGNPIFDITDETTVTVKVIYGGIIKNGSGTLIFSTSANDYAGPTQVNAGKLLISGNQALATGAVTIAAGATLGGNGTVGGATTISGIHAPGNDAVGTQTFSSSLEYAAGSAFSWQLGSESTTGTYDKVTVGGGLTVSSGSKFDIAVTNLDLNSAFWSTNQTWNVFNAASVSGGFTVFNLYNAADPGTPVSYEGRGQFSFDATSGQLQWIAAPSADFSAWIGGFPDLTDKTAAGDPDGDGFSNLIEYALGLQPGIADAYGAVAFGQSPSGISLTYRVSKAALQVSLVPEWSAELGSSAEWNRSGIIIEMLGSTPDYDEMRATLPIDSADSKRFLRLSGATQ